MFSSNKFVILIMLGILSFPGITHASSSRGDKESSGSENHGISHNESKDLPGNKDGDSSNHGNKDLSNSSDRDSLDSSNKNRVDNENKGSFNGKDKEDLFSVGNQESRYRENHGSLGDNILSETDFGHGIEKNHDLGGNHATSPIPEPETYVMLLTGLGIIGFLAYRKKKSA